ncbi:MAG: nucleotidyltransferase domain-containing protein [Campylobacterota bacterium]|nr:nucleotidyltransferase domain-containing protein [Campylobacterota bacterium]
MIDKLTASLRELDSVLFAYLFGSQATKQTHNNSDVDVAVFIASDKLDLDEQLTIHHALSKALHQEIDLVILNNLKSLTLLENILKDGVLLKDTTNDLRELFELKSHHDILDYKAFKRSVHAA